MGMILCLTLCIGHRRPVEVQRHRPRLLQGRRGRHRSLRNRLPLILLACQEMGQVTLIEHLLQNHYHHCRQQIRSLKH